MTSTGKHHIRRGGWVILGVLLTFVVGALVAVAALQRYVERQEIDSRQLRQTLDAKIQAALAAPEKRRADREAAVEQARANLPPDAGIPRDWSYDELIESFLATDESRRQWLQMTDAWGTAIALLKNADQPQSPNKKASAMLEEIQGRIREARTAGTTTQIQENLDLSKHSREDVLSSIDMYLRELRPLQEAESAYTHGILSIRKHKPDKSADTFFHLSTALLDILSYRALFEARRGDVDKAIRSCTNACDISCRVYEAQDILLFTPPLRYPSQLIDLAWRTKPLTQEQRDRLLAHIAPHTSPERMEEILYEQLSFYRNIIKNAQTQPSTRLSKVLVLPYDAMLNSKLDSVAEQLKPLLAQPPYRALPLMEKLLGSFPQMKIRLSLASDSLVEDMAKDHARCALNNCIPDVARVAFALKDYKYAHGEYPKTLDGLCPDPIPVLPMDPLSGQPMLYASDGKTFAISLHKMTPGPGASEFLKKHAKWVNDNTTMWFAME